MSTRDKISDFMANNPDASYRDIMRAVGLKSTSTVAFHLRQAKTPTLREQLKALRRENDGFRKALQQISSCKSYHKDDVVAIAIRALAVSAGAGNESGEVAA
jgi:hypothetical protein